MSACERDPRPVRSTILFRTHIGSDRDAGCQGHELMAASPRPALRFQWSFGQEGKAGHS
jgi:hypothetical protein